MIWLIRLVFRVPKTVDSELVVEVEALAQTSLRARISRLVMEVVKALENNLISLLYTPKDLNMYICTCIEKTTFY